MGQRQKKTEVKKEQIPESPNKKMNNNNNIPKRKTLITETRNENIESLPKEKNNCTNVSNSIKQLEIVPDFSKTTIEQYLLIYKHNATVDDIVLLMKQNQNNDLKYTYLGKNAIINACEYGCSLKVIKFLVSLGVDYNKKDIWKRSALHYACNYCSKDVVEYLIYLGLNLLETDVFTLTSIHRIGMNENPELLDFINDESLINIKDNNENTIFHYACWLNKNLEIIKMLISKGANINLRNLQNQTPFDYGVSMNANPKIVHHLINLVKK